MYWIVQRLNDVSDWFYGLYLEALGWPYPFWLAATHFYNICQVFNGLAWDFYDLARWVDAATGSLGSILSWSNIRSLILGWLPDLTTVIDWWHSWTKWVGQSIDAWWSLTKGTVLALVAAATQDLRSLLDGATAWLAALQSSLDGLIGMLPTISEINAWFSDWWGNILPFLTSWWNGKVRTVQGLIDSAFTARETLWSGWQDVRDNVLEFFSNPLDWLLDRFTDWFLGPEK